MKHFKMITIILTLALAMTACGDKGSAVEETTKETTKETTSVTTTSETEAETSEVSPEAPSEAPSETEETTEMPESSEESAVTYDFIPYDVMLDGCDNYVIERFGLPEQDERYVTLGSDIHDTCQIAYLDESGDFYEFYVNVHTGNVTTVLYPAGSSDHIPDEDFYLFDYCTMQ